MGVAELQNEIIKELLNISDEKTLVLLKEMLSKQSGTSSYIISDFEKNLISESIEDYKKGNIMTNDEVFKKNDQWLNE